MSLPAIGRIRTFKLWSAPPLSASIPDSRAFLPHTFGEVLVLRFSLELFEFLVSIICIEVRSQPS